jgi:hypothetical protein
LSSAVRLYVLRFYKDGFVRKQEMFQQDEITVQ